MTDLDATGLGFELLPVDDEGLSAEDALNVAADSALAAGSPAPVKGVASLPFGRTWEFDHDAGRMRREGAAPREVRGLDALRQWCLVAANTARYAHAVFSDEFGVELLDAAIGEVQVRARISDYERRIRAALMVHDRIASVDDFRADYDPTEGVLFIENFTVTTDEGARVSAGGVSLRPEEVS